MSQAPQVSASAAAVASAAGYPQPSGLAAPLQVVQQPMQAVGAGPEYAYLAAAQPTAVAAPGMYGSMSATTRSATPPAMQTAGMVPHQQPMYVQPPTQPFTMPTGPPPGMSVLTTGASRIAPVPAQPSSSAPAAAAGGAAPSNVFELLAQAIGGGAGGAAEGLSSTSFSPQFIKVLPGCYCSVSLDAVSVLCMCRECLLAFVKCQGGMQRYGHHLAVLVEVSCIMQRRCSRDLYENVFKQSLVNMQEKWLAAGVDC